MRAESSYPGPADRLGSESTPVRILSLLSHPGNQRVLADWVQQQEQYEIVSEDHAGLSAADFDIGIVDEQSLREYDTEIRERRADAAAVLPILLVCPDTATNTFDTPDRTATALAGRQLVDEVLSTPIDIAELQRRLDSLARIRSQSLVLERKTDQLLLLNRITRHDIRNDMSVILGWTEQLADHTDDAGDEIRQRILDSSQHVVDLTKAVREFVNTLQTAGEPDLQAVDLKNVMADELTKRRATFDGAEFVVDGTIPEISVRANDLLASVFRNVLNNAVQHNDSDTPRVVITVVEHVETVAITVADNGPAIAPGRREAVLGRTEQGLDHPAAGLGLYLVDTLVTQYGGTVQITDADLGGAAIEIELQKTSPNGMNTATDDC